MREGKSEGRCLTRNLSGEGDEIHMRGGELSSAMTIVRYGPSDWTPDFSFSGESDPPGEMMRPLSRRGAPSRAELAFCLLPNGRRENDVESGGIEGDEKNIKESTHPKTFEEDEEREKKNVFWEKIVKRPRMMMIAMRRRASHWRWDDKGGHWNRASGELRDASLRARSVLWLVVWRGARMEGL